MSDDDTLADAIATALGVPMVTRWVLVAECIDEDGEPQVWEGHSPGLPMWQQWGLLSWIAQGLVPQPDWTEGGGDE